MSIYFASSQLLSTVAKALTLWFGARLIGEGTLTTGLLIAFLLYLDQFFSPLQQLSAVFDQWIQARVALGRLDELLATPTVDTRAACTPSSRSTWARRRAARTRALRVLAEAPEALRGVDLRDRAGRERRPGGHDRRRQVDVRQARRPLLRPDRRAGARRRHRPARPRPARLPAPHRLRAPGAVPVLRHDPLQHRLRPARRHRPRGRARPLGRSAPTTSSRRCPRATSRRWPRPAGRCRPASASCCAWPGPSSWTRRILILDEATSNLDLATEAQVQRAMSLRRAGPDHAADRPPPADRPPRVPHRRRGGRARRRGRQPRRARRRRRPLRLAVGRLRSRHPAGVVAGGHGDRPGCAAGVEPPVRDADCAQWATSSCCRRGR